MKSKSKEFVHKDFGLLSDPNKVKKKNSKKKTVPTEYVKALEREANKPAKKNFKFGKEMCKELEYYTQKYGEDYQAMARDKKNIYQDSPGQLRYKIKKYIKIHKSEK